MIFGKYIFGGLSLAVLGLSVSTYIQGARLDAANRQIEAEKAAARTWETSYGVLDVAYRENLTAFQKAAEEAERYEREAEAARTARAALQTDLLRLKRNARNAPQSKNGPVADVLCDALDGLRGKASGGPACYRPERGGDTQNPGQPS